MAKGKKSQDLFRVHRNLRFLSIIFLSLAVILGVAWYVNSYSERSSAQSFHTPTLSACRVGGQSCSSLNRCCSGLVCNVNNICRIPTPTLPQRRSPTPTMALRRSPTPPPRPGSFVALVSAVIDGSNLTVSYSKNFATCVHLLNATNNAILHTQNYYCPSGNQTITKNVSLFDKSVKVGLPVKLCHGNNYNICSAVKKIVSRTISIWPQPSPTLPP